MIGRTAKYVSANDAEDYVFGYMVTLDISDCGGRPPGGNPLRSDWFVGKTATRLKDALLESEDSETLSA